MYLSDGALLRQALLQLPLQLFASSQALLHVQEVRKLLEPSFIEVLGKMLHVLFTDWKQLLK